MTKINPITCVATSDLEVQLPDDQGRYIVLYFYPKDDTPGCTIEGQDFTRLNQQFIDNNAVVYGVSLFPWPLARTSKWYVHSASEW